MEEASDPRPSSGEAAGTRPKEKEWASGGLPLPLPGREAPGSQGSQDTHRAAGYPMRLLRGSTQAKSQQGSREPLSGGVDNSRIRVTLPAVSWRRTKLSGLGDSRALAKVPPSTPLGEKQFDSVTKGAVILWELTPLGGRHRRRIACPVGDEGGWGGGGATAAASMAVSRQEEGAMGGRHYLYSSTGEARRALDGEAPRRALVQKDVPPPGRECAPKQSLERVSEPRKEGRRGI